MTVKANYSNGTEEQFTNVRYFDISGTTFITVQLDTDLIFLAKDSVVRLEVTGP